MSEGLAQTGEATASPTGTTPEGEAPETVANATAPAVDPSQDEYRQRIESRLDELGEQNRRAYEDLMSRLAPEEPEEESLEEGEDGYEEQQLQQWLAEQIDRGVQERLTPVQVELQRDKRDQSFKNLQEKYPEFRQDDVQRKYVSQAASLLERLNPRALDSPDLIDLAEVMYKADKADERAAQETPATGRGPQLERDGGAAPSEPEESLEERLMKKHQAQRAW